MDFDFTKDRASNASPSALHQVLDYQHRKVVGWTFEYPAGWQARSEMQWNFQDLAMPVHCHAQAFDIPSGACFEFLPDQLFAWVEPNMGMYQQGQNVMGQVCMKPMSCADTLARWVVPRFRANHPDLRILRCQPAQIVRRIGLNLQGMSAEEAFMAIEYTEQGKLFEEEIYGVKAVQLAPYFGPMGAMTQINWGIMRPFCFRAPKGQLEPLRETFWKIACSVKINPAWEQLLAQVLQQLKAQFDLYTQMGYSQIQAASQLSHAISANNDAMLANFAHQRQAAHISQAHQHGSSRTTHDNFSDMMRGVETMNDPYWGESQQDANYLYHWTDGQGNYQHSDDPFFNPSIGSNIDWTLMERKER